MIFQFVSDWGISLSYIFTFFTFHAESTRKHGKCVYTDKVLILLQLNTFFKTNFLKQQKRLTTQHFLTKKYNFYIFRAISAKESFKISFQILRSYVMYRAKNGKFSGFCKFMSHTYTMKFTYKVYIWTFYATKKFAHRDCWKFWDFNFKVGNFQLWF